MTTVTQKTISYRLECRTKDGWAFARMIEAFSPEDAQKRFQGLSMHTANAQFVDNGASYINPTPIGSYRLEQCHS